ncbi:MAG: DUF5125 domain-containing protein [Prevotella sp.]|nr:DUF5125 domain-containing protein [Prevotella sp.]
MKKYIYSIFIISAVLIFNACSDDDDKVPGNPEINAKTDFGSAMFGDSLPFIIDVSDNEVPLSTLKVRLFYSDEMVSEAVIRTKTDGEYSGKIYIPFYANIPNGTATLKLVLQNIHLTITEKEYDLPLTRPDYPYLTLVTADEEIRMERKALYNYEVKKNFPMKISAYIKAPPVGTNGNEITFGWEDNAIIEGSVNNIPFSNFAGEYSVTFNTLDYQAAPFIIAYAINDVGMTRVNDDNYKVEMDFEQGQEITVSGIDDFSDWWIDQDFFVKSGENLTFTPITGKYRITADFNHKYLRVETMSGNGLATLQADGTGAIWIIGDNIGKPSLGNTTGWDTGKGICMAPVGGKKYQVTLVAGTNVTPGSINFKFFYQRDWGGEFSGEALTTTSDIVFVGNGSNGRDSGNLGVIEGKSFTTGKTYVFTVDVSAGIDMGVLTVVEK